MICAASRVAESAGAPPSRACFLAATCLLLSAGEFARTRFASLDSGCSKSTAAVAQVLAAFLRIWRSAFDFERSGAALPSSLSCVSTAVRPVPHVGSESPCFSLAAGRVFLADRAQIGLLLQQAFAANLLNHVVHLSQCL